LALHNIERDAHAYSFQVKIRQISPTQAAENSAKKRGGFKFPCFGLQCSDKSYCLITASINCMLTLWCRVKI